MFVPFFISVLFVFYLLKTNRMEKKRQALNHHIGEKFPSLPLLDAKGNTASINLSAADFTIVDLWFKNCPGCIVEMQQFSDLLKGKETQVSIVSVSIDPFTVWEKLFDGGSQRFSFLAKPVTNWQHLLIDFTADSTAPVGGATNNAQYLAGKLGVTGYPAFFVLDKKGIIKATPASAVDYIKTAVGGENKFIRFLKSPATWKSVYVLILTFISLLFYIAFFNKIIARTLKR